MLRVLEGGEHFSGREEAGEILLKLVKDGRVWTCENEKRVLCRKDINKGVGMQCMTG